ncbi:MAG: T9SS type A sorting domain-containing protein [Flavobacteriaceae bacterium]
MVKKILLSFFISIGIIFSSKAQCEAASSTGTVTATNDGTETSAPGGGTLLNNQYFVVDGLNIGDTYETYYPESYTAFSAFLTVRNASDNSVVGSAIRIVEFVATTTSIEVHIFQTNACSGFTVVPIFIKNTTSTTHTWDGSTDSDWATAANWDTNAVPGSSDDVIIPSGLTNYPTASGAVTVSTVSMAAGSSLIANSTFAGTVTYNRELTFVSGNLEGWYLVAPPVSGEGYDNAYITANDIASGSGNNRGIATYLSASNTWDYFQTNESLSFTSGLGYAMKRGTTTGDVSFSGTLNTSNVNGVSVSTSGDGFNLLGNPFTSYINSQTFLTANTNLDAQIWTWSDTGNMYTVRVSGDAFMLAPGQGFFVKANSGSTVNFAVSNQAHNGSDTFQRTANNSRTEVHLLMSDGEKSRFTKLYYMDGMTTGFDNGWEGETFGGIPNALDVYTELVSDSQGDKYQIQSLPNSDYESMIIPVGVISEAGDVSFTVESMNLPTGYKVFLEDKEANNFIRLDDGSSYDVTFDSAQSGIGRFFLYVTTSVLSIGSFDTTNISAYMSSINNLKVVGIQQGTTQLVLFDILGQQVFNSSFEGNGSNDVSLPDLRSGVYIVHLRGEQGRTTKKIVIQ